MFPPFPAHLHRDTLTVRVTVTFSGPHMAQPVKWPQILKHPPGVPRSFQWGPYFWLDVFPFFFSLFSFHNISITQFVFFFFFFRFPLILWLNFSETDWTFPTFRHKRVHTIHGSPSMSCVYLRCAFPMSRTEPHLSFNSTISSPLPYAISFFFSSSPFSHKNEKPFVILLLGYQKPTHTHTHTHTHIYIWGTAAVFTSFRLSLG